MNKLLTKITSMIKRSRVSLSHPDTGDYPIVQITYLGKTADMEVIWPYGMNGRLPVDAIPVCFNIEAMEENKAGVGTTPTLRDKLENIGETSFGNPVAKTFLRFLSDTSIELTNGTGLMTMLPDGSMNINGAVISPTGEITNSAGIVLGTHTHAQGNDSDGNTEVETEVPT